MKKRAQVHVRNGTPRVSDSSSGPGFGNEDDEEESVAVEIKAIDEAILESHHEDKQQDGFFANQYWRAPDICDQGLEDLLKEEGFY
jgi:cold shock CspA family protein